MVAEPGGEGALSAVTLMVRFSGTATDDTAKLFHECERKTLEGFGRLGILEGD